MRKQSIKQFELKSKTFILPKKSLMKIKGGTDIIIVDDVTGG